VAWRRAVQWRLEQEAVDDGGVDAASRASASLHSAAVRLLYVRRRVVLDRLRRLTSAVGIAAALHVLVDCVCERERYTHTADATTMYTWCSVTCGPQWFAAACVRVSGRPAGSPLHACSGKPLLPADIYGARGVKGRPHKPTSIIAHGEANPRAGKCIRQAAAAHADAVQARTQCQFTERFLPLLVLRLLWYHYHILSGWSLDECFVFFPGAPCHLALVGGWVRYYIYLFTTHCSACSFNS
jgi:hypothetical protein